jgi:hypothetical protein
MSTITNNNLFFTRLNGNNRGLFHRFIQENKKKNLNICWYPSSGLDLRNLRYISHAYTETITPNLKGFPIPDLFIHSDYMPWEHAHQFFEQNELFRDENTTITVVEREWLTMHEQPANLAEKMKQIVNGVTNPLLKDKALFLKLQIDSAQLGNYQVPLFYVFAPNEDFFQRYLKSTGVAISHIVHVRYGGGLGGGGNATGSWLLNVLAHLEAKVFITDGHLQEQHGDRYFLENVVKGRFAIGKNQVRLIPVNILPGEQWSNHGDVTWNIVNKVNGYRMMESGGNRLTEANRNEVIQNIMFKAFSYLLDSTAGRTKKSKAERDKLIAGCVEILHGNGFSPRNPMSDIEVSTLYKLMRIFGFEKVSRSTDYQLHTAVCGALDKIVFKSRNDGIIEMFNFCPFHRCI